MKRFLWRIWVLSIVFSLLCAGAMGVETAEETASDGAEVSYCIIARYDGSQFGDGLSWESLEEIVSAVGFLYPEYVKARFSVLALKQDSTEGITLFSGSIDAGMPVFFPEAMVTVSSVPLEKSIQSANRIVLIGQFSNDECAAFLDACSEEQKWLLITEAQSITEEKIPWISAGSVLSTAKQIYEFFEEDSFPQQLVLETTTLTEYSLAANTEGDLLACHILAEGIQEAESIDPEVWAVFPNYSFYSWKQSVDHTLQLANDGHEKEILICRSFNPYSLDCRMDDNPVWGVKDKPSITVEVRLKPEYEKYAHCIPLTSEEWHAQLYWENRDDEPIGFSQDGMCFFSCLDLSTFVTGEHQLILDVWNERSPSVHWQKIHNLLVENHTPELTSQASAEWVYYLSAPIDPNVPTEIDLSSIFTDDGGAEFLSFSMEPSQTAGVSLAGSLLSVVPEELTQEETLLHIIASDQAGQKSCAYDLRLSRVMLRESLNNGRVVITLNGGEQKGTPLSVCAEYFFTEDVKNYFTVLTEEQQDQFRQMLHPSIQIDGKEPFPLTEMNQVPMSDTAVAYEATYDDILPTGNHTIEFLLSLNNETAPFASETATMEVKNQRPQILFTEESIILEIPGPFFLNQNIETQQTELKLDAVVGVEPLDVITLKATGKTMRLYKINENAYLFTDEDAQDEPVDSIHWDTAGAAPSITIRKTCHGSEEIKIYISDQDGAAPEVSPLILAVEARYRNQHQLFLIFWIAVGLVLALNVSIILVNVLKPRFTSNHQLTVTYDDYHCVLNLHSWKKKGISLQEVLIFSGAPIPDVLPPQLEKVSITPGRREYAAVIRNAKKYGVVVIQDNAEQDRNRILVKAENPVEINLGAKSLLVLVFQY